MLNGLSHRYGGGRGSGRTAVRGVMRVGEGHRALPPLYKLHRGRGWYPAPTKTEPVPKLCVGEGHRALPPLYKHHLGRGCELGLVTPRSWDP